MYSDISSFLGSTVASRAEVGSSAHTLPPHVRRVRRVQRSEWLSCYMGEVTLKFHKSNYRRCNYVCAILPVPGTKSEE